MRSLLRRRFGTVGTVCSFFFFLPVGGFSCGSPTSVVHSRVAQQSATFAEAANYPAGMLIVDFSSATSYHYIGDQAQRNFTVSMALLAQPSLARLTPNFFGFDQRIYAPISLARALWLCGCPDQARRIAKSVINELLSRVNPLSICIPLTYCSPIFLWSGDFRTAEDYVERLIEYAGRHSLEPYRAAGLGLNWAQLPSLEINWEPASTCYEMH